MNIQEQENQKRADSIFFSKHNGSTFIWNNIQFIKTNFMISIFQLIANCKFTFAPNETKVYTAEGDNPASS